ncbi:MAG: 16S rRNA (cytidine(1402)-2'-O)-methyltransferase [Acidobacteriota bacterium]
MAGTLYLVATPIGNLKDMSLRAIETLKNVDVIACEDTRHTRKLLNHYDISKPTVSYHEHNEETRSDELIKRLNAGVSVAVVSDAGTPGINDPGFVIVQKAIEAGVYVVPIPGPVAFAAAVTTSGLATESIFFGGFLPSKSGDRRKRLAELAFVPATLVFYESPNRLARSLADCLETLGNRDAAYGREITKLHEEFVRGSLDELAAQTAGQTIKGEIVLMIDRARDEVRSEREVSTLPARVREIEAEGTDPKQALKQAAREFGVGKSEAYRLVQADKSTRGSDR